MKTSYMLSGLFLASFAINIYYFFTPSRTCNVNTPGGYTTSYIIDKEKANRYSAQFERAQLNNSMKGGVITRSVFDDLLCDEKVNGIVYRFAVDTTLDNAGPRDKGMFLILSGANVEYDYAADTVKRVNNVGCKIYSTRNWCPTACMNF